MKLSDYISKDAIVLDLKQNNKSGVINELVDILSVVVPLKNKDKIISLLEERETLSTTGIGNSIAVPHCKSAEINDLFIVLARSKEGIDFNSLDKKPVNLFFLLVSSEQSSSIHLKALARIARFTKDPLIREKLLSLDSANLVLEFIKEKEIGLE
ncbi:MAG: PTS sugar transporter subunit IIA [Flavobacteriaceae bacterium]|nr:PTS sugar transporter subunit IIA [Flavobacteriaceae bacterium]